MKYRQLEVFHAVMMHGTLTKAAEKLGVSQPSVTSTLKHAEADVGVPLFHRTGGRLVPTDEARAIFVESQRANDALIAIRNMCERLRNGNAGHIRVVAIPTFSHEVLPDAIVHFRRDYPAHSIHLLMEHTSHILDQFYERSDIYDLGFTFGVRKHDRIGVRKIGEARIYCAIHKDLVPSGTTCLKRGTLPNAPRLGLDQLNLLEQVSAQLVRDAGVSSDVVVQAHSHQVAGSLALRGQGYAILDEFSRRFMAKKKGTEKLLFLPIEDAPTLPVTAVYPLGRELSPALEAFLESFKTALAGNYR